MKDDKKRQDHKQVEEPYALDWKSSSVMGFLNIEPLHVFLIQVVLNLRLCHHFDTPHPPLSPNPPPTHPYSESESLI